jgi:hypothetical protein
MDPPTLILVGWIRILIQGQKIWLTKKSEKISYFVVLTQLDVLFWGLNASPVAGMSFIGGLRISKLQFFQKIFLFFQL